MNQDFFNEIISLPTEQINPKTINIDEVSTIEILKMINDEDKTVPFAVEKELAYIEQAVNIIVESFRKNGRLIYVGAGTSGRLGVIDAVECPPTFGVSSNMVIGIIAGGKDAMFIAQEGAEDSLIDAIDDLNQLNITPIDVVCGIAASGRTPYVISAVNYANSIGCRTIMLSTSKREEILKKNINADVFICPYVGPEIIAGSTRMKSGTAQKLVLNMLTTASMIQIGKTFGNIMVDLQQTNAKLTERSKNIIMKICNVDYDTASELLIKSNFNVKTAIVMNLKKIDYNSAIDLLQKSNGKIKQALSL
jgi:N-acetylmuramic acid 6-phosphate etherase